ncbi:YceD family protein [Bacillus sp. FSL H8-0547]
MKWSINELNKLQNKGLQIDETIQLTDMKGALSEVRDISPVSVTGRADLGSSKAVFHLTLAGTLILPCARTLVDVPFSFEIHTTETFLLKPNADFEMEEDVHHVQEDIVDLIPVIKENILLEVPMQVFSDSVEENDQAAPQEGKDWKVISEEENKNKIDPRLAGLSKFFDDQDS